MVDETENASPAGPPVRAPVFQGIVTLGNILIMLGMLAGGVTTVFVVGGAVQKIEDAVVHEADMRTQTVKELGTKIDTLTTQETRDVADIKLTISDLRADLRQLVTVSPPPPRR